MAIDKDENMFVLTLVYNRSAENPIKIFDSIKSMLESLIKTETSIIKRINPDIEITYLLSDIEKGSIVSTLIRKIIIPENNTGNLIKPEIKGNVSLYVNKSIDCIAEVISRVSEKKHQVTNDTINEIHSNIKQFATETGVFENSNFRLPDKVEIADSVELMKKATDLLYPSDSYILNRGDEKATKLGKIQTDINKEVLQKNDKKKINETIITVLLTIKTADFLGSSKWNFKSSDGKSLSAKIEDKIWLSQFHNRDIPLSPGDSLYADILIRETYVDGINTENEYTIVKVNKVIRDEDTQGIFEI